MRLRSRRHALAWLLVAWQMGCAPATTITLRHEAPQAPGVEQRPGAVRVTAIDARPEAVSGRLVVGTAPDPIGIGPPPADYTAAEPIRGTFSNALEAELRARGFRVEDSAGLLVRLEVLRFFSEGRQGGIGEVAEADLEMGVSVAAASGETRYSRRIVAHGKASVGVVGLGRTGAVQAALQQAMDGGFAALLGDEAFLRALTPPSGSS